MVNYLLRPTRFILRQAIWSEIS